MNKVGLGFWLAAITVCSGLGALVFTVSTFGRSSPLSASKEWILLPCAVWVLLFAWAMLFSWLASRLRSTSWRRGLRWAALCHAPLAVCLPLVFALYSNDLAYHAYAIGAYGLVIFEPLSRAYVILAPVIAQCWSSPSGDGEPPSACSPSWPSPWSPSSFGSGTSTGASQP